MVVRLANCDCNTSPFINDFPLDVLTTKIKIELDDGVGDGIDGSCKRSLNVGGVNGGHDVSPITFYHLLITFQVACPSMAINWAKTRSFATPLS
jgi:hypothetical protein